jgi:hypothetical protein
MSQVNTMTGDARPRASKAPAGRAVFLLAVFVLMGVWLLHELDSTPTATWATSPAASSSQETDNSTNVNNASATQTGQTGTNQATTQQSITTPVARTPADIKLLVANGVGVNGAAAKVAGRLQPVGYQMLKPGNTTTKMTASQVQYAEGYATDAQAVATALGLPSAGVVAMPTPASISDLQGANIVVIVGNDLAATGTASGTGTATGTGTAAGTTGSNSALNGPLSNANTTTTAATVTH